MTKMSGWGVVFFIAGLVLVGFQGLSAVMKTEGKWESINLFGVVGGDNFTWISSLPADFLQSAVSYVVNMPLFLLLLIIGAALLIISGIYGR